jgi:hypothetical protein
LEPAERSLQLAKPAAVRCAGKLISGVVLQVVAFLAFAVDMALFVGTNEVTNNAQAGLVVLAGLAIGYALWVKGMTRPFSPKAHEQEVLWHAGGMLLAVLAGAPLVPAYKGWMLALGLGAWAVFVAPVAVWGLLSRRALRLQAQGWSADPPPGLQELRPWILAWLLAALGFVATVAASLHLT